MKTIVVFFVVFSSLITGVYSHQDQKYDKELPLLIIKNKHFDSVVSETIFRLKKCDDTESYVFSVNIKEVNDIIYCDIISCDNQKFILVDRFRKPYGYFSSEGHLFFVFCDFSPDWLEKSNKSKAFTINDFSGPFYVKEYPEWLYIYDGQTFFLDEAFNECQ